jgi:hypothetical protein
MDYLNRACKHLGVDPGSAINPRVEGDEFVVIIDRGIAGCPKYRIPLSELTGADVVDVDEVDYLGVYDHSYRELQEMAKDLGIPANQGRDDLIAALWPATDEEE